jgi:hypothetical protein
MSNIEIICKPDCKNSPRKTFLKEFNSAYAKNDAEFIIQHAAAYIVWYMHGDKILRGIEEFSDAVLMMANQSVSKLVIESIITHGKEASASGVMIMGE